MPTSAASAVKPSAPAACNAGWRSSVASVARALATCRSGTKWREGGSTRHTSTAPATLSRASTPKPARQDMKSVRCPSKKRPRKPPSTLPVMYQLIIRTMAAPRNSSPM